MPYLQRCQLSALPQACILVRGEPMLENPHGLQRLQVLRLGERVQYPLHMPWLRGQGVLRAAVSLRLAAPAVGFGLLVSLVARGFGGTGWVFALLVLSAAVAAIVQQTLP